MAGQSRDWQQALNHPDIDLRATLRRLFGKTVDAVEPENCLPPRLHKKPSGRTTVARTGKESGPMARVAKVQRDWERPLKLGVQADA
jgi:glycerate-2-kinase